MPHGFFTIEQWKRPRKGAKPGWVPILHLDSCQSMTKAAQALENRGKPGLYRVVQTRRCIWAQIEAGKLRLHASHAGSPESLARLVQIYEVERGRRPVEKARQDRARAEAKARGPRK
jgi:hypothetical protein